MTGQQGSGTSTTVPTQLNNPNMFCPSKPDSVDSLVNFLIKNGFQDYIKAFVGKLHRWLQQDSSFVLNK